MPDHSNSDLARQQRYFLLFVRKSIFLLGLACVSVSFYLLASMLSYLWQLPGKLQGTVEMPANNLMGMWGNQTAHHMLAGMWGMPGFFFALVPGIVGLRFFLPRLKYPLGRILVLGCLVTAWLSISLAYYVAVLRAGEPVSWYCLAGQTSIEYARGLGGYLGKGGAIVLVLMVVVAAIFLVPERWFLKAQEADHFLARHAQEEGPEKLFLQETLRYIFGWTEQAEGSEAGSCGARQEPDNIPEWGREDMEVKDLQTSPGERLVT